MAPDRVIALSGLKQGQNLTTGVLEGATARLGESGYFQGIKVATDPKDPHRVVLDVVENPAIERIEFIHPEPLTAAELQNQIALKPGDVISQHDLETALRVVREYYFRKIGCLGRVNVTAGPGDFVLRFTVTLAKIGTIRVEGLTTIDPATVLNRLKCHPGDSFRRDVWNADYSELLRCGLFSMVRARPLGQSANDEVEVVFDVKEAYSGVSRKGAPPRPQLALLTGHAGIVSSAAVSADGSVVTTGAMDGSICVWNGRTGELVQTLNARGERWITDLALSPDGRLLASGSIARVGSDKDEDADMHLCVWDLQTGAQLCEESTPMISTLGFTESGRVLVYSSIEPEPDPRGSAVTKPAGDRNKIGFLMALDARTGRLITKVAIGKSMPFMLTPSADGRRLAVVGVRRENGKPVGLAEIWDSRLGHRDMALQVGRSEIMGSAFSPDGATLATVARDAEVCLWDTATGRRRGSPLTVKRPVRPIVVRDEKGEQKVGWHPWDAMPIAFLAAGHKLLVSDHHSATVWDIVTRKEICALEMHGAKPIALACAPDGTTVVGAAANVTVASTMEKDVLADMACGAWNVKDGRQQRHVAVQTQGVGIASALTLSTDGAELIHLSSFGRVQVWNAHTGELQHALPSTGSLQSYALSADGRWLAVQQQQASSKKVTISVIDLRTGDRKRVFPLADGSATGAMALSPDGSLLAVTWSPHRPLGSAVRFYDTNTGLPVGNVMLPGVFAWWAVFSPRGDCVAIAATAIIPADSALTARLRQATGPMGLRDGSDTICIVDARRNAPVRVLPYKASGMRAVAQINRATTQPPWTVTWKMNGRAFPWTSSPITFTADGGTLSVRTDNEITTWSVDMPSGTDGATAPVDHGQVAALHPDGHTFLTIGDLQAIIHDDPGQRHVRIDGVGMIGSASFSVDGSRLLTSSLFENSIQVWDTATGWPVATLLSIAEPDQSRPTTPAQKPIQAISKPIEAISKPIEAISKAPGAPDDFLVVTPEGYYSGSAAADRFVRFRLGERLYPAECFQARFYRPDLVKRVLQGEAAPEIGAFHGPLPPVARIVAPGNGSRVTGDFLNVTVEASDDSAVTTVALYVNGARVAADLVKETVRAPPGARTFTAITPIPPGTREIKLAAIAIDDDRLQSPRDQIVLTHEGGRRAVGRLLGLCVGVSQYEDPRLRLRYADRDASALAAALSGQKTVYRATAVTPLINGAATRSAILAGLEDLAARAERADTVVISFSGHGWRDSAGRFYFATPDVDRNAVATTSLPWDVVATQLQQISSRCRRVLVFLDACHSGSAATNDELHNALLASHSGVLVLASSHGNEVSLEVESVRHGVFTQALIEAIAPRRGEGAHSVTLWDFASYVKKRVRDVTNGTQNPKVPSLIDFEEDAPLFGSG